LTLRDYNITTPSGTVYFNFCRNTLKSCPEKKPSIMVGFNNEEACHRMAGNDTQMNKFALQSK